MIRTAPAIPPDPGLPGARGLFTGDGERAVSAFLADRGWQVEEARAVQAMYRPGRSCLVRYRVAASGPRGRAGLTLCAETRTKRRRSAGVPEGFEEQFGIAEPVADLGRYLVWAYPYDPTLRDLPDAAWGPSIRERLAGSGRPPSAVAVEPLRYRPRRRAVFRYRTLARGNDRRWQTRFGKVLPSEKAGRAESLVAVLRRARGDLRFALPHLAGRQLVISDELEGRSLRELLIAGRSLPAPDRVSSVPRRISQALAAAAPLMGRRPSPMEVAEPAGRLLTTVAPELEQDVRRIVDAVAAEPETTEDVVHGDLYEAQLFVRPDWSLGLIDLDDLSIGDPVMDAANFCAHLLALALSVPAAADRLVAYRRLIRPAFARTLAVDERDLAWREALCMLQLAAGPFRVLDPLWPMEVRRRVQVAVRLLEGG